MIQSSSGMRFNKVAPLNLGQRRGSSLLTPEPISHNFLRDGESVSVNILLSPQYSRHEKPLQSQVQQYQAYVPELKRELEKYNIEEREKLTLKDMKLSVYLQKNPECFQRSQKKCNFRFSILYVYTILIIAATILFLASPATAKLATKWMISVVENAARIKEPGRAAMYCGILFAHQLLGLPLQTVSIALICFATNFLYGYSIVVSVNIVSSVIVFVVVRYCLKNFVSKRFKDNVVVQLIVAEAALNPIKVSVIFRFMYIPSLYKNLGLSLSKVSPMTFFIPALIEDLVSNCLLCLAGTALNSGMDALDPTKSGKGKTGQIILYFTYTMSGIQIVCIAFAIIFTILKLKKIRKLQRMLQILKDREDREKVGYVHDLEPVKKSGQEEEASETDPLAQKIKPSSEEGVPVVIELYNYNKKESLQHPADHLEIVKSSRDQEKGNFPQTEVLEKKPLDIMEGNKLPPNTMDSSTKKPDIEI